MADADLPLEHVTIEPRTDVEGVPPGVFVLHGRGATERDLLSTVQRLPKELFIVSLRAPDELMGRYTRYELDLSKLPIISRFLPSRAGYSWYELGLSADDPHQSQPHPTEFRCSLDLAGESIEAAVDTYELDPDRIGLLGFSQGAIVSLALLLEAPTEYDWVAALHGYLPEAHANVEPAEIEGTPVFVAAGAADQVIPASRAEAATEHLRELGCDVQHHTYQSAHTIEPDELADLIAWVKNRLLANQMKKFENNRGRTS